MGELVILGANAKLEQLRSERENVMARRRRITDRIRAREPLADPAVADELRSSGWIRW